MCSFNITSNTVYIIVKGDEIFLYEFSLCIKRLLTPQPPMHWILRHSLSSSIEGGMIPIPQSGLGHKIPPARKTCSSVLNL